MKVLIGITQNLDSVKNELSNHDKYLGISTETGPLKTKGEAEHWKNFMMQRRENYEEIQANSTTKNDAVWFGFTVESPILH